jgi:F0F1-type ATP synthase assembly protein I
MITFIIGLVIGFIAGALVFRNNAKKAEAIVQKGSEVADKAGIAIKNFKK